MTPDSAAIEVKIAVPQRYKDFVVRRQYRWSWYILAGALGGVNAVYYLLCLALHWTWKFDFQADMVVPVLGLIAYVAEVKKPWHYEINERFIKLFVVNPRLQLANLKEVYWAKTEIVGIEPGEWQELPMLKINVLPASGHSYLLVYSPADEEEIKTKVLPLVEKYRYQFRQELWADKLRI